MSYFSNLFRPERYHGASKNPPFFEGWYYKLVDSTEKHRFAVIPGIVKNENSNRNHAFIQILNGSTGESVYKLFPHASFKSESKRFAINVGSNHFSETRLALNIKDPNFAVAGTLILGETAPWQSTLFSPNIMGPYAYLPNNMDCNHGIVSLNHELIGHLMVKNEKIVFTGGKGYIGKNWGRAYPPGYIWMQSNHFSTFGTSFVGAVAIVQRKRSAFSGFIIGLRYKGFLHHFATYNGAKTSSLKMIGDKIEWVVKNRRKTLTIKATLKNVEPQIDLDDGVSEKSSGESLLSNIALNLKDGTTTILNDTGRCAGIKVFGDIEQLLSLQK